MRNIKILYFLNMISFILGVLDMHSKMINKSKLICIKTGSKAKIVKHYELENTSYVKINITMKFDGTNFQVLKTLPADEIEKEFKILSL